MSKEKETDRQREAEALLRLTRLAQTLVEAPVSYVVIVTAAGRVVRAERGPPGTGAPLPPGLAGLDAQVWRAATSRPQSMERLAAAVGRRNTSAFRRRVRRLVDAGFLLHVSKGYRRA